MTSKIPLKQALLDFLQTEDPLDYVCSHIACGGTLVDLAETLNVRFVDLRRWINEDDERKKAFAEAVKDRDEWAKDAMISELKKLSMSDVRSLFNDDGSLKPISEWPAHAAHAVSAIEVNELFEGNGRDRQMIGHTKKLKLWSKEKAIELFGKHLSMFVDRHEVSGKVTLEDLIEESKAEK